MSGLGLAESEVLVRAEVVLDTDAALALLLVTAVMVEFGKADVTVECGMSDGATTEPAVGLPGLNWASRPRDPGVSTGAAVILLVLLLPAGLRGAGEEVLLLAPVESEP